MANLTGGIRQLVDLRCLFGKLILLLHSFCRASPVLGYLKFLSYRSLVNDCLNNKLTVIKSNCQLVKHTDTEFSHASRSFRGSSDSIKDMLMQTVVYILSAGREDMYTTRSELHTGNAEQLADSFSFFRLCRQNAPIIL